MKLAGGKIAVESIGHIRAGYGCSYALPALILLCLFLCSCASLPTTPYGPKDIRTVNVLIGIEPGSHDENEIMGLFQQFNGESVYETGIILNPVEIIPFDMSEQQLIWPACKEITPCWADYAALSGYRYDAAVLFIANTPLLNFLIGGVLGTTDITQYRYIILKSTDYRVFKHELYHMFHHGHSLSGLMFPIENFMGIPIGGTALSEDSREEVLKNKWRTFP